MRSSGSVEVVVLRAPCRLAKPGPGGGRGAAGVRGSVSATRLLEVSQGAATVGPELESQASLPRVLRTQAEPSPAREATPAGSSTAAAVDLGSVKRRLVGGLHKRCALPRSSLSDVQRHR